jgi:endogenous inhibitor of DNA gyrase (YacG/DUF329 family)
MTETRNCSQCGSDISHRRKSAKTCSRRCKDLRRNRRDKDLRQRYGITEDDFNQMYADQEGKCAICSSPIKPTGNRADGVACVDHCHATGEVHGLLCVPCNTGIGSLGENPDIVLKALQYLLDTAKVPTR